MGDFARIQLGENGQVLEAEQGPTTASISQQGPEAAPQGVTIRDLDAEKAAAAARSSGGLARAQHESAVFDANVARIEQLDEMIAAHERAGERPPAAWLKEREHRLHDAQIVHASLTQLASQL